MLFSRLARLWCLGSFVTIYIYTTGNFLKDKKDDML